MSKPCQGVQITPIKGAELRVAPSKPPPITIRAYTPPAKRKEELKAPTVDELQSETLFPCLSPMKPLTPGASWNQLRSRLSQNPFSALDDDSPAETPLPATSSATSLNFKRVMEERIKREQQQIEQDTVTHPAAMTATQRELNGWATLTLPVDCSSYNERLETLNTPTMSDTSVWSDLGGRMNCVYLVEDTEYLANSPVIEDYFPTSDASANAAKQRLLNFCSTGKCQS